MMSSNSGELDNLISSVPHARFITCPIFGAPPAAAKALLIAVMSGDYRSKKEVAYLLVPAAARKVIDLGGNVEKGLGIHFFNGGIISIFATAPTFKLIGNSLILGTMEVMAESLTLAEKAGVDPNVTLTLLNGQPPHVIFFKSMAPCLRSTRPLPCPDVRSYVLRPSPH
jgi:3-hydroxyisobutyrate dehydrogenase-like beta-hydroxyacid dehydrogenase